MIDQIDYLTLRPRPCRFLPLILKEIAASSNWKKFSLKIGLSKGGRRGERDPPELHQRTLGCTSLTSTCVNNSLLFLSFLLPRFRSSVSLSLSQFSKFLHLLSPLLPSFQIKLYFTFLVSNRCPNFSFLKVLWTNLIFFFVSRKKIFSNA